MTTHRSRTLSTAVAASAIGLLPLEQNLSAQSAGDQEAMNILIIFSEDHGSHFGCYGDPIAHTPNFDRLAAQGVRFTNAYVPQATCSPSRASLLTGLYPQQHGQIGLSVSALHRAELMSMHPGTITLPQLLRSHGYRTGVIGKIHINPHETIGFDWRRGSSSMGDSIRSPQDREIVNRQGERVTSHVRYSSDVDQVTGDTVEFLEQDSDQPFFLYIATGDVHPANLHFQIDGYPPKLHEPEFFADKPFPETGLERLGPNAQRSMAAYYNGIDRLDILVGKILEALDNSGQADNTLVMFLSDHGPSFPGRGGRGKMTCYEGGLKVPFLMRWPGRDFPPVFDGFVSSLDVMPTALQAAGIEYQAPLPGQSLVPVLDGDKPPHPFIFGEFNRHSGLPPYGETFWPLRSVRDGDLKLIHNPFAEVYRPLAGMDPDSGPNEFRGRRNQYLRHAEAPDYELYDLSVDPYELNNLADDPARADDLERLQQKLAAWQQEVGDFLLDPDERAAEQRRAEAMMQVVFGIAPGT